MIYGIFPCPSYSLMSRVQILPPKYLRKRVDSNEKPCISYIAYPLKRSLCHDLFRKFYPNIHVHDHRKPNPHVQLFFVSQFSSIQLYRFNELSFLTLQCSHSHTRSDLLAYLQRVALYSHQLTITAKVKSEVQIIGGEVIVSEVRSLVFFSLCIGHYE